MSKPIRNLDKQGNRHGVQIDYWSNGDIRYISNYHHGKRHGYRAWFNLDKTIDYKSYYNMSKRVYAEDHWIDKQIEIKI